jgi:hypothetical protein
MCKCLRLFSGCGHRMERAIVELYVNGRVQRIDGVTNEIMKGLAAGFTPGFEAAPEDHPGLRL